MSSDLVFEGDKTDVLSCLSATITGISKQLKDTMAKGLAEATSAEEADSKAYDALITARKEVAAQTDATEQKTVRSGELAVDIVQMKNDLSQTHKSLEEDKEFLANLKANCVTKCQEWNEISKTRSETLPSSAGTSLMQVSVKIASFRQEALNLTRNAETLGGKAQMHLLLTALRGKAAGFEKVVAMTDEMVALLKKEQADDEEKKEYCEAQFDSLDDKKKALERTSSGVETQIYEAKYRITTSLEEDKEFLANLKANCVTKCQEWNEISKTKSETLPSSARTSLMQVSVKNASFRQEALNLIRNAETLGGKAQMHLLLTALRGKAAGFEKVVAMTDDMVALLKKEQADDEEKKEYCEPQFDSLDDKKKALERTSSGVETQICEAKDRITTLVNEIESFRSSIVALDKSVSNRGVCGCDRAG